MLETLLQSGDMHERCGVILKDGKIVEVENLADDPRTGFELNFETLFDELDNDLIAATWHTHPDSDPNLSGEDYASFLSWPELEHIIIGFRDGKVTSLKFKVAQGLVFQCD